tara:strand:- start:2428 stop:2610 length:183 start_codon:yes stop_codon:yes gene_type:complete
MQVNLTQKEYAQFKNRVAKLSKKGIALDHTVAGANKRVVKLTMHKEYDWEKLDEVCDGEK